MSESLPFCQSKFLKVSKFHDKNSKRATQRHGENLKEMRRSY